MPDDSATPSESDLYSRTRFDPPDPRERLQRLGVRALSSTDLLALVIGSPTTAQGLVRRHGIPGLANLPLDSWRRQPGVGKARSARLSAVFELGRRAYSPAADYFGPDSFTYKANDGLLDSNIATVSISVAAANDAPAAGNDSYSATEDTQLNVAAPGVLANDNDPEGSPLTAIKVTNPAHGSLNGHPAGI